MQLITQQTDAPLLRKRGTTMAENYLPFTYQLNTKSQTHTRMVTQHHKRGEGSHFRVVLWCLREFDTLSFFTFRFWTLLRFFCRTPNLTSNTITMVHQAGKVVCSWVPHAKGNTPTANVKSSCMHRTCSNIQKIQRQSNGRAICQSNGRGSCYSNSRFSNLNHRSTIMAVHLLHWIATSFLTKTRNHDSRKYAFAAYQTHAHLPTNCTRTCCQQVCIQ